VISQAFLLFFFFLNKGSRIKTIPVVETVSVLSFPVFITVLAYFRSVEIEQLTPWEVLPRCTVP
jgi:hypothetical protein